MGGSALTPTALECDHLSKHTLYCLVSADYYYSYYYYFELTCICINGAMQRKIILIHFTGAKLTKCD